jgi:hypothetical protein
LDLSVKGPQSKDELKELSATLHMIIVMLRKLCDESFQASSAPRSGDVQEVRHDMDNASARLFWNKMALTPKHAFDQVQL